MAATPDRPMKAIEEENYQLKQKMALAEREIQEFFSFHQLAQDCLRRAEACLSLKPEGLENGRAITRWVEDG